MCQIVCSIADTCSAAGCMLSEINTQEIYSPADTNYKTARGCQHTLELNYSDVIYLIHYYFGLYSSFMKKLHILPNINGLFLRHTESQQEAENRIILGFTFLYENHQHYYYYLHCFSLLLRGKIHQVGQIDPLTGWFWSATHMFDTVGR